MVTPWIRLKRVHQRLAIYAIIGLGIMHGTLRLMDPLRNLDIPFKQPRPYCQLRNRKQAWDGPANEDKSIKEANFAPLSDHRHLRNDKQNPPNEKALVNLISKSVRNLPIEDLYNALSNHDMFYKAMYCTALPCLYDIRINSVVWQRYTNRIYDMYLYSAYLDIRDRNNFPGIRVFVALSIPQIENNYLIPWCQIWNRKSKRPTIVKAANFDYLVWSHLYDPDDKSIMNTPFMFTCPLSDSDILKEPYIISIVEQPCDMATNALKVGHSKPVEKARYGDIAVCIKGVEFPFHDISIQLIEWLEIIRQMNVNKVFIYHLSLHENVTKVLDHYVSDGLVETTFFPLPGDQPNLFGYQHLYISNKVMTHVRHEKLAQHDCFYRNLYHYKYVAIIDLDEMIVPTTDDDWQSLLIRLEKQISRDFTSGYMFSQAYLFDNWYPEPDEGIQKIPEEFPILRHIFRTLETVDTQKKTIHRTDEVVSMSSHKANKCLSGPCQQFRVNNSLARLHHFRKTCNIEVATWTCRQMRRKYAKEKHLWKHKADIIKRSQRVLRKLGFLSNKYRTIEETKKGHKKKEQNKKLE